MKISALKENNELRVAITPDSAKKFIALGVEVSIEKGAGEASGYSDDDYKIVGADIVKNNNLNDTNILLTVNRPDADIPENTVIVGALSPATNTDFFKEYADKGISAYSLESLPRISRAQSMDILSSQSNLAGYRAVIEAIHTLNKAVPMMMTAAGTVAPAKILILGAGIAGLQAIATAKRIGGAVSAFDVRPSAKEQVESLGAKFIEVTSDEIIADNVYAKEMSDEYKQKQADLLAEIIKVQDIVIATALIPNRPAPIIITKAMVDSMKNGSVIVDLAAIAGGNCEYTKLDKIISKNNVKIIGYSNLSALCCVDASSLYARNLYNFTSTLMIKNGELNIDSEDELIAKTLVTMN